MWFSQSYLSHWKGMYGLIGTRQCMAWLLMFGKCSWKWILSCLKNVRSSTTRRRPRRKSWKSNENWYGRDWQKQQSIGKKRVGLRSNRFFRVNKCTTTSAKGIKKNMNWWVDVTENAPFSPLFILVLLCRFFSPLVYILYFFFLTFSYSLSFILISFWSTIDDIRAAASTVV